MHLKNKNVQFSKPRNVTTNVPTGVTMRRKHTQGTEKYIRYVSLRPKAVWGTASVSWRSLRWPLSLARAVSPPEECGYEWWAWCAGGIPHDHGGWGRAVSGQGAWGGGMGRRGAGVAASSLSINGHSPRTYIVSDSHPVATHAHAPCTSIQTTHTHLRSPPAARPRPLRSRQLRNEHAHHNTKNRFFHNITSPGDKSRHSLQLRLIATNLSRGHNLHLSYSKEKK